jgi:hypothetical protein
LRAVLLALLLACLALPAEAAAIDGRQLSLIWTLPFAGILLSIALMPILTPGFWHHHYGKVAAFWGAIFLLPFMVVFGPGMAAQEVTFVAVQEYIPFIVLLLALYTRMTAEAIRMRIRSQELAATQERVPQALATLGPTLNATANLNYNVINTNVAPTRDFDSQSLGLLAAMPLYRPANRELLRQSELSVQVAEIQLEQARQDLILRVSQAYFDVLSAQDSLSVIRAQKQAFGEQFASARRNFEVGTATITDQQEAQSRLDLTRAQEVAFENDLEVKRARLAQLIGRPVADLDTLKRNVEVRAPEAEREGQAEGTGEDQRRAGGHADPRGARGDGGRGFNGHRCPRGSKRRRAPCTPPRCRPRSAGCGRARSGWRCGWG